MEFSDIYKENRDVVYNVCLHYLQNVEDAEDASQEIFVLIHDKINQFKGDSTVKTWVYRITVNYCLDFLKSKSRAKRWGGLLRVIPGLYSEEEAFREFNHPGIILEKKEETEQLLRYINELPAQQKTAIILTQIEGLTQKEAAEIIEVSIKAVESLVGRAKTNLKKMYDKARD